MSELSLRYSRRAAVPLERTASLEGVSTELKVPVKCLHELLSVKSDQGSMHCNYYPPNINSLGCTARRDGLVLVWQWQKEPAQIILPYY